jgi:hypothetical protein
MAGNGRGYLQQMSDIKLFCTGATVTELQGQAMPMEKSFQKLIERKHPTQKISIPTSPLRPGDPHQRLPCRDLLRRSLQTPVRCCRSYPNCEQSGA